jgi:hypothetical protein
MWSLIFSSFFLFAADPGPKFGPEFTFAPPQGVDEDESVEQVRSRMVNHLIHGQRPMAQFRKVTNARGRTVFLSPNGWNFTVALDPGVIEITMSPMTVGNFERFASDIQDAIFASAANEGNFPMLFLGGGHINIDFGYFKDDPLLFRNFIVDLLNHNELFMGAWGYDTHNAISPWLLYPSIVRLTQFVIRDFDRNRGSSIDLIEALRTVWSRESRRDTFALEWGVIRTREFGISFAGIDTRDPEYQKNRIEIRAFRPQASVDVFVRQIRLIKKRIDYLKTFNRPIPLKMQVPFKEEIDPYDKHFLSPPLDPQRALENYHRYVIETGEKWEDHQDYLWPAWISDGHLLMFNESLRRNSCDSLLGA